MRKNNKSAQIRRAYAALGHNAAPATVQAILAEEGVQVSRNLCSAVKGRLGPSDELTIEGIIAAKQMVSKVGSVETAKAALEIVGAILT